MTSPITIIADMQAEIDALRKDRDELLAVLDKLARLGNEPNYGNSIGNQIAIAAIANVKGGA